MNAAVPLALAGVAALAGVVLAKSGHKVARPDIGPPPPPGHDPMAPPSGQPDAPHADAAPDAVSADAAAEPAPAPAAGVAGAGGGNQLAPGTSPTSPTNPGGPKPVPKKRPPSVWLPEATAMPYAADRDMMQRAAAQGGAW